MRNIILFILTISSISILSSCKVCKTCQCWKNGNVTEQSNCSYGFPPSTSTLDAWDEYLVEIAGYDSVKCVKE
ncbi:MAG: hypothetical protein LBN27_07325 [Prevotellaceae bacterium]|jgi:hypothetical protein|nr:hypothetical protein [Prevotellaceae bacterium]